MIYTDELTPNGTQWTFDVYMRYQIWDTTDPGIIYMWHIGPGTPQTRDITN